jgi:exosortase
VTATASAALPATASPAARFAWAIAAIAFVVLFAQPISTLARDWWNDPDAGHGLLLAPLAIWLAWRAGLDPVLKPKPVLGGLALVGGVTLRYLSGLAAELFTMRLSLIITLAGLVLFFRGWPQIRRWGLAGVLLALSIPLPALLTGALALPLQLRASEWGAALLRFRHVPVLLSGNVIRLPNRDLFVTEACSGLRSLSALVSLGVLSAGLWLRTPIPRVALVLMAIPVAMVVNAFRVFLTGFLVHYVSPELGEGFMHLSEGWLLFVAAFILLSGLTFLLSALERRIGGTPVQSD